MQTEFEFTLPCGYVDGEGNLHRNGVMRLATAIDEIAPLKDLRVKSNQAYFVVVLLSRVIARLGSLPEVNTKVVENLFSADLAYLQDLYRRINQNGHNRMAVTCPNCSHAFEVEVEFSGE